MSLASIHTSLPENNTQSNTYSASLDHVETAQIREDTRKAKDIPRVGRFTIRVSLSEIILSM